MQFSDSERLLGIMLAEIMETLEINREIDPSFVKRALINHDDWSLNFKYNYLASEPVDPDIVSETADILSMMSFIEFSVRELPDTVRPEFEAMTSLRFRGFDGNHDDHGGIAHTFINDLHRFSEFDGRELNSHSQATLQSYRRIKPIYDHLMSQLGGSGLSADQLRTIDHGSRLSS